MNELSDADVMTAAPRELSDADVMAPEPAQQPISKSAMGAVKDTVEPVLNALGQGWREGWGPDRLGISDEGVKWLSKVGVYAPEGTKSYLDTGWRAPFYAMNELLAETIWKTPEIMFRAGGGMLRAGQQAVAEIGEQAGQPQLGRDIAALPEAFFGSPHPTGMFKTPKLDRPRITGGPGDVVDLPVARDLGVVGEPRKPITEGTPAEAAKNAVPPMEAYHGSPYSFDAFDTAKIGTGEGAQVYGHGLYFAENEKVAAEYRDKLSAGAASRALDSGYDVNAPGAVYKVRIHADRDAMLDWDKPLSEQPGILKKIKPELRGELEDMLDRNGLAADIEPFSGRELYQLLDKKLEDPGLASKFLHEAGIPGIKYLDQGSRGDLAKTRQELQQVREAVAKVEGQAANPSRDMRLENLRRDEERLAKEAAALETPTRNLVVFDHNDVEITHKNGEPVERPQRAAAADQKRPEVKTQGIGPNPVVDKAGNIRLDLIDKPEDVLNVIRSAAEEAGGSDAFMSARRGEIPLAQQEALSQASGIPVADLDVRGMGRLMRNDNEVRAAITAMIQSAEDTAGAMKKAALTDAPEDLIEFQRLRMRHSVLQEQVAGLTAEWGRTGNVFQEFSDRAKDAKSLGQFLKDKKGETIDDLRQMAKEGSVLDREQMAKFLNDSRREPPSLMYWTWVNGLISGLLTHTKYIAANAFYAATERGIVTPIAALIGKAKGLARGDGDIPVAAGKPVEAAKLRSARAQGEQAYMMSPEAIMEPEPYHRFTEAAKTLPDKINDEFQAHGFVKGSDENLINILRNGIDPNRTFHSGHPRGGAFGMDSTRTYGAPYVALSERGKMIGDSIKHVVAVGPAEANIPALQAEFPKVNFMTTDQALRFMETGETPPAPRPPLTPAQAAEFDRVFFGEALASVYGMIAATPTSFLATAKSIRAGVRAPLESEVVLRDAAIARGEKVPAALDAANNPVTQNRRPTHWRIPIYDRFVTGKERPINQVYGRIIGTPGDSAMGIHTFFKIIGERAGIEERAYSAAAKEGLNPSEAEFWERRSYHAANPTEEMRKGAVEDAYKGTFMQDLGPHGRAWQKFTKETPALKWLFPFSHIPVNLMKATYEYTPFAFLDGAMRDNITGKNGGIAQDKAIARMVVGSAIMGYLTNLQMTGQATGDYPTDPKERDHWKLVGMQPNSVLINGYWVSYDKFGPAGSLANIGANIGAVIHHLKAEDDDAMSKATWHVAEAAGHLIVNEVGFMSLQNLFEALHDEKKGASFAASTASSFLPFSSLLSQTASGGVPFTGGFLGDPNMREAKTFVDALKYRIPGQRETLLPKRDWSGTPIANPQYGNIIRQRQASTDPVDLEMDRLGIHPAPPENRIGGVKMPAKMYDTYQSTAGPFTRQTLENIVTQPGWQELPAFVREETIRGTIRATRAAAAAAMQARYPQLIQQGIENRTNHITGQKPTSLRE